MFKLNLFAFLSIIFFSSLVAVEIPCSQVLKSSLNKIQQVPECRELIERIVSEGPIRIVANNTELSEEFGAFWDDQQRIINIAWTPRRPQGEIIQSILFEMHNAAVSKEFKKLDDRVWQGGIDRANYVKAVEYLEYKNSKMAAAIADKAIRLGIFPRDASMFTYRDFQEHFYYQRISGHSHWIAKNYDIIKASQVPF